MTQPGHTRLGVFFALVTMTMGLAACQRQSSSTAPAQTITLMQTGELTSLDNSLNATLPEFNTLTNTSEGLYKLNQHDQPMPAMAEKIVRPTNGGTRYTIKLRDDARWSNGQPVTATDFVTAWRRGINPKLQPVYSYVFTGIKNATKIAAGKAAVTSLGIKALTSNTLQIELDAPMPYFNKLVTMPVFLPQNTALVKKTGRHYATSASTFLSNGAFKVAGWTGVNDSYRLVRNPYYYARSAVKLKQINYLVVKDANTAKTLFNSHQLDDATLTGTVAAGSQHDPDVRHVQRAWTYYLQLNQRREAPLANQKLRAALSLVIDKQALTKVVLADGSTPASTFVSPGVATDPTTKKDFATEMAQSTKPNIKRARQLWREGVKGSALATPVSLQLVGDDQDVTKNVAQYLQAQIQKALPQAKVNIQSLPQKGLQASKANGNFALSQWYWLADFADPINYFDVLAKGSPLNSGDYQDATYQRILTRAHQQATNEKVYWQAMRDAEKRLQTTRALIPLYYANETHLVNPRLKNIWYHHAGEHDYTRAYLASN